MRSAPAAVCGKAGHGAGVRLLAIGVALVCACPGLAAQAASPLADTLREPPVLHNLSTVPGIVEVELTAAPARLSLLPGAPPAEAFAYNGSVPGPTLEASEGDSVIVHFHNALPEATTVHWHGLHLPADADGSPLYPIAPGASHTYAFRIPVGTAGTYWYHPHPDRRSSFQVAMGLFAAFIVRSPHDPVAERGIPEKLLILQDNRFGPDGAPAFARAGSVQEDIDLENGREGDVLLVNGQVRPTIPLRPGELQRWRILNASAARVYRLALRGQPLVQIATDGGLFERPLTTPSLLLANSERAEIVVRGEPGDSLVLEDLPYDRYMPQTRPAGWDSTRVLLRVATTGVGKAAPVDAAAAPVDLPAELRPVAALDTSAVAAHRVIVLSQGLIDGRTMDMARVDQRARLGSTEIWTIQNVVGMDHPFHLHGFRFQVLDRDGVPEPFRSWKDSVNVPKHSSVRIVVAFPDYPGKWMYHCHILDHEDEGMMGILELH
jgi:FtsP/CotA-like multicopper oxidase with cupredoxin domain